VVPMLVCTQQNLVRRLQGERVVPRKRLNVMKTWDDHETVMMKESMVNTKAWLKPTTRANLRRD
jgi:hypothetical protein